MAATIDNDADVESQERAPRCRYTGKTLEEAAVITEGIKQCFGSCRRRRLWQLLAQ